MLSLVLYLSEHLWEVIDISGAKGLCLETLGLQQVFGDIWGVDEHAMQWTLFVSICLEHDLKRKGTKSFYRYTDLSILPKHA